MRNASHLVAKALVLALLISSGMLWDAAASSPAHASDISRDISQLYTSVSIPPPSATRMTVCYGFVCRLRSQLDFSSADRHALTRLLAAGRHSAAAERTALRKAVVWFDRKIGPAIGTDKRVARADFRSGSDKTNFDCWDTTRNTTSLLLVLQQWDLLKHHVVGSPRYRGNVLLMQTPHNTAAVTDKTSGQAWVVDMWTRAYAELPEVMPAEQWAKQK